MKNLFVVFVAIISVIFASCGKERKFVFKSKEGTKEVAFYNPKYHPLEVGDSVFVENDGYIYDVIPEGKIGGVYRRQLVRVDSIIQE